MDMVWLSALSHKKRINFYQRETRIYNTNKSHFICLVHLLIRYRKYIIIRNVIVFFHWKWNLKVKCKGQNLFSDERIDYFNNLFKNIYKNSSKYYGNILCHQWPWNRKVGRLRKKTFYDKRDNFTASAAQLCLENRCTGYEP
jgi:hypothetical protein